MESIEDFYMYAVAGILVIFAVGDVIVGSYHNGKRSKDDFLQEAIGFIQLSTFIKPAIVFVAILIMKTIAPSLQNTLSTTPFLLGLALYMLTEDFMQYWYHRLAHEIPWLWKLHRPHHATPEMGAFVSYRNATLYYAVMPNIWWTGICTYLGLGPVVLLGLIIKQLVIISSHSTTKWDQYLYKNAWLNPLTWIIERTIVTPAAHFAHHGKSAIDGISNPNGNFSNTFIFWDLIFNTAIITRKYPEEIGLQNDTHDTWYQHLYYPFFKSKNNKSEISKGFKRQSYISKEPIKTDLAAGKHLWCACGMSEDQPFCNGSHQGSKKKPILFELKKKRTVSICTCKLTKSPPYCDDSHLGI